MRRTMVSFSLVFCFLSAFAQSDEINISASFAQSIELRIASGANINFTFSSLNDYERGKAGYASFQVASSTSFEVSASFTPLTNADGDQIDIDNITYHVGIDDGKENESGIRWNFAAAERPAHNLQLIHPSIRFTGYWVASETPKTLIPPGTDGNAGSFDDNTFHLKIHLGIRSHLNGMGKPSLLDQNIQPGTYTCTMTLTAIPSIT